MSAIALVSLHGDALEQIHAFSRAEPRREVGGVLFGCAWPERAFAHVKHVCGPGPCADLGTRRLHWDPSYILGYLDAIGERGATAPIGRWHKHCLPDLRASDEDRAGAAAFREALGIDALVDVIVGTVHDEPIGWAAYLCTAARYERIVTELPNGARG